MRAAFDSGRSLWQGAPALGLAQCAPNTYLAIFRGPTGAALVRNYMVKAEWGTKHGCPKCGTRFYDLGKDDPVTCVECGYAWLPDPVLKSKQPIPYEEIQKEKVDEAPDVDLAAEDLDIDEDGDSPDNDVDLGGDDDLGVGIDGDGDGDEN
jgi:uncharacterized protein (TIGR02300 family)